MMLSIVIPAYNERNFIEEVVRRVMDAPYDKEIIIVDDGSTDGTREILKKIANCELRIANCELRKDRTGEPANRRIGVEEQRTESREQRAESKLERFNPYSGGTTRNSKLETRTENIETQNSGDPQAGIPTQNLNEVKVIFHEKNMGKGGAVRNGVSAAKGDIIIIQDADLEYDPKDYPRLLEPILEGKADVVYGSRFLGGPHRVHYFWHYVGNMLITLVSNMATGLNLTDMETGYKVFKREVFQGIEIKSNRFGFEPEITAKVARKDCVVYEVPISYYGRSYEEGKKITWKDGVKAVFTILKYKWFSK